MRENSKNGPTVLGYQDTRTQARLGNNAKRVSGAEQVMVNAKQIVEFCGDLIQVEDLKNKPRITPNRLCSSGRNATVRGPQQLYSPMVADAAV